MRTKITKPAIECDGCQYLIGESSKMITVTARGILFEFHDISQRHDCFRYWAHGPHIMRRSLEARGLGTDEVDEFMSLMLYREKSIGPGVSREPVKT